ncbi:SURF1 family cytochrome oxidase biogenesis protein [Cumulibacter manganitolerans]|uniref:SURF1 family cytochrome oxidase biogenesis protein n=1 Tax=Cumulibacter manganitolerans TaxID=1884992 RepID=UPI001295FC31|nr:SURF1 family protein [Cumulibacter manganitolerans]
MYRFLATPRWIAGLLVTLLLAATMVRLGFWQLDRLHQKQAINAAVATAQHATPVPAGSLLPPSPDKAPATSAEWTRVSVTGSYLSDRVVLIRQRTFEGGVGFEVIVPLKGDDGVTYLIDRGYILAGKTATDVPPLPRTPEGTVTITGYVKSTYRATSAATRVEQVGGYRSVRALSTQVLSRELGVPLAGGYVQAAAEKPASGAAIEAISRIPVPEPDEGPHLSYAVQWWLFSLLTLFGFGYLARREAIDRLLGEDEYDDYEADDRPQADSRTADEATAAQRIG